jgi:hypothetical protein
MPEREAITVVVSRETAGWLRKQRDASSRPMGRWVDDAVTLLRKGTDERLYRERR